MPCHSISIKKNISKLLVAATGPIPSKLNLANILPLESKKPASLITLPFKALKRLKDTISKQKNNAEDLIDSFTKKSSIGPNIQNSMDPKSTPLGSLGNGDFMTMLEFGNKDSNTNKYFESITQAHSNDHIKIESEDNGIPFYFQDLRDNAFIFFRAYIDGLSDTISPNWSGEN